MRGMKLLFLHKVGIKNVVKQTFKQENNFSPDLKKLNKIRKLLIEQNHKMEKRFNISQKGKADSWAHFGTNFGPKSLIWNKGCSKIFV